MENSRGMKWNGGSFAFGISCRSCDWHSDAQFRNPAFPVRNRFHARLGVGAWALDCNFDRRKAHGHLGNLFAGGQPVFYVQLNGILDVFHSFFVRVALADAIPAP